MRTLSLFTAPALVLTLAACDPAPPTIDPLPSLEWKTEPRVTIEEPPLDAGPPPPSVVPEPEPPVEPDPVAPQPIAPVVRSVGAPPLEDDPEAAGEAEMQSAPEAAELTEAPLDESTVWIDDQAELAVADPALADDVAALQDEMALLQEELAFLRDKQEADKRQAELDVLLTSIVAAETAAFVIAVASQSLAPAQFAPARSTSVRSAPAMSQSRKSAR